ncbi:MAG TPA: hypothetical protein VFZ21_25960 [Gemmatimonadaceae bacterium]|nr:hypothetical protein [Gemmatimonadaceae bacterium]
MTFIVIIGQLIFDVQHDRIVVLGSARYNTGIRAGARLAARNASARKAADQNPT